MRRFFDPMNFAALGFALSLLVAWQLLADMHLISPIFFPSPLRALAVLQHRLADGSLWLPLAATSLRMSIGWLAASVIGVVLGAAIGSSRFARDLLDPTLEFIRPLPASAVIPVAILFLGLSNAMSVTVIAFGAIWPVLLASVHGFSSVNWPMCRRCSTLAEPASCARSRSPPRCPTSSPACASASPSRLFLRW